MRLLESEITRIPPVSDFAQFANNKLGLPGPGGGWSLTLRGGPVPSVSALAGWLLGRYGQLGRWPGARCRPLAGSPGGFASSPEGLSGE